MGKIKLNLQAATTKISKDRQDHKNQLSSLIKVLRPKVYITDSSTFKSLVQELTGNGNNDNNYYNPNPNPMIMNVISSSSSSPPPPPLPPTTTTMPEPVDHHHQQGQYDHPDPYQGLQVFDFQESSLEMSSVLDHHNDSSSSPEPSVPTSFTTPFMTGTAASEVSANSFGNSVNVAVQDHDQMIDLSHEEFKDIESLLLDINNINDHHYYVPNYNYYDNIGHGYNAPLTSWSAHHQEEACVYDYDLSGLL